MSFAFFLAYTSALTTILLPTTIGVFRFKYFKDILVVKGFFYYFIVAALVELVTGIMGLQGINNLLISNIFFLVQCVFLTVLLLVWIQSPVFRYLIISSLAIIVCIASVRLIFIHSVSELDNVSMAIESIILILASGIGLLSTGTETTIPILRNYRFWFCSAIFLYFSLSIAVFCTSNIFLDGQIYLRHYTWVINLVLTIASNILFSTGLLCLPLKKTSYFQ